MVGGKREIHRVIEQRGATDVRSGLRGVGRSRSRREHGEPKLPAVSGGQFLHLGLRGGSRQTLTTASTA